MDFETLKEIIIGLPTKQSIFIRGKHGIGKSNVVEQIGEELELPVIQRRLSQLTEGDIIGLPDKVLKDGRLVSTFLPMEWFAKCLNKPYLIFLDEIDRAINEVIQACFELVLDRTIQGNKIHEGCRIIAAGNSGKNQGNNYQVSSLDPAFLDRFWVADVEPKVSEWLKWAEGRVLPIVMSFIEDEPECLEEEAKKDLLPNEIYPTRRAWERLSNSIELNEGLVKSINERKLTSKQSKFLYYLCCGFLGGQVSSVFVNYIKRPKEISLDNLINDFDNNENKIKMISMEDKVKFINRIAERCEKKKFSDTQIENIFKFFKTLPDELKMVMNEEMSSIKVHFKNSERFVKRAAKILREL